MAISGRNRDLTIFAITGKDVNLPDVVHLTVLIHILASFLKRVSCAFRVSSTAFLFLAASDSETTCFAFDMLVAQPRGSSRFLSLSSSHASTWVCHVAAGNLQHELDGFLVTNNKLATINSQQCLS